MSKMADDDPWLLKEDGCLNVDTECKSIIYHASLNVLLITTGSAQVYVFDVNSGVILQRSSLSGEHPRRRGSILAGPSAPRRPPPRRRDGRREDWPESTRSAPPPLPSTSPSRDVCGILCNVLRASRSRARARARAFSPGCAIGRLRRRFRRLVGIPRRGVPPPPPRAPGGLATTGSRGPFRPRFSTPPWRFSLRMPSSRVARK